MSTAQRVPVLWTGGALDAIAASERSVTPNPTSSLLTYHTHIRTRMHTHTHTHTVLTYTNTQYYLLHPVSYVECNMRGHSETHKRTRTGEPWLRRKQLAGVSASCFLSNTSKLSTSLPLLEYDSHDSRSIVANT